ncbi:formate dehydrogenase accessory sulfurtransferase FdhD [Devriesea agamarum]|uniref:formate dehydrogenase accessory sulfurtransferase FdhD n=1 Tax=Devriesea agamarum TaxID=472569 RepID=UPI00071DB81C|nr:formate dehydrogenase accessory sulfurtransferase FdhD [Devriesea agamarum]
MGRITASRKITSVRVRDGRLFHSEKPDHVAVEEPLDLRLNGEPLSLTMRTPGHDVELAHGFLHAEGLIASRQDVIEARYCDGAVVAGEDGLERNTYNVLDISTHRRDLLDGRDQRRFAMNSSCGVCGSTSIDAVVTEGRYRVSADASCPAPMRITPDAVLSAVRHLSDGQSVFQRTGGVHAAGIAAPTGDMLVVREDVGRHNAVDKVIGWALQRDLLPLAGMMLVVSSRASFEIVQKAYMAGVPMVVCASAPSSLALATAERVGMTICGFTRAAQPEGLSASVRGQGALGRVKGAVGRGQAAKARSHGVPELAETDGRFNLYTGADRLDLSASESAPRPSIK